MVSAFTRQGEPILGTRGEKTTGLCTLVLYKFISLPAKTLKFFKECNPAMVAFRFLQPWPPNLCIDQKLRFDNPRCVASFSTLGIEQMDSKQEFLCPSSSSSLFFIIIIIIVIIIIISYYCYYDYFHYYFR